MKTIPSVLMLSALVCLAGVARSDRFDASPRISTNRVDEAPKAPRPLPPGARVVQLRLGELKEVYVHKKSLTGTAMAFYLPPEATAVATLVREEKLGRTIYFVKGVAVGRTVGGVVEKGWLTSDGTRSDSDSNEARVQQAIQTAPLFIEVSAAAPQTP